jgi:transposase
MDEKDKIIQDLKLIIIKLIVRIEELEKRLGLNSKNSSKPPSSDGFKKLPPSSLRQKSKNFSGGQKGHDGHTLKQVSNPDKIIRHELTNCPHCKNQLSKEVVGLTKRQVFDIPPVKIEITEHQAETKICSCCKKEVRAEFPLGINVPAQYGSRIKAQAVYLGVQHFIPEDRLQAIFQDLYGAQIATATLVKFSNDLAGNLGGFCQRVLEKIKLAALKHMDETGFRIGGKTTWLHVASNEKLTYYHNSPKRKSLFEGVTGTIVHDHWKPYYQINTTHALCNAHHLRELQALIEDKEAWAKKMKKLLLFMHKYRRFFVAEIPQEKIKQLERIYTEIIDE